MYLCSWKASMLDTNACMGTYPLAPDPLTFLANCIQYPSPLKSIHPKTELESQERILSCNRMRGGRIIYQCLLAFTPTVPPLSHNPLASKVIYVMLCNTIIIVVVIHGCQSSLTFNVLYLTTIKHSSEVAHCLTM